MDNNQYTTKKFSPVVIDTTHANDIAALVIIRGEPLGKTFPISEKTVVIGRSSECTIQFGGDNVSRRHCQVWKTEQGFWISDLKSTNNTLVNSEAVQYCQLFDGDRITIGDTILKFLVTDMVEQEYHSVQFDHATRDPLTGTHNRRLFIQNLRSELDTCSKFGQPLSLVVCDIDHFKQVNDQYDHTVGDKALVAVTDTLQHCLRPGQTLARMGGEEFAIILPALSGEQALEAANIMREAVASKPISCGDAVFRITASFGVAEWSQAIRKTSDLIRIADQALMKAKKAGRNQVKLASPMPL